MTDKAQSSVNVLTLLTALRHRSALRTALSNRDEATLQPVLRWVIKNINRPRTVKTASEVAFLILDLYSEQMGETPEIDHLVKQLHRRVGQSAELAQQAWSTTGMLDLLMAGT